MSRKRAALSQRAVRHIVSSLLAADFTTDDLKALAQDFRNGDLSHATSVVLEEAVYHLKGLFETRRFSNEPAESDELADLVKRKRVSKRAFMKLVNGVLPGFFHLSSADGMTMNDMVRRVIDEASVADLRKVTSIIDGGGPDQFLSGILNK